MLVAPLWLYSLQLIMLFISVSGLHVSLNTRVNALLLLSYSRSVIDLELHCDYVFLLYFEQCTYFHETKYIAEEIAVNI